MSKIDQVVKIASINLTVHFNKGEPIHTEISRKYDDAIIENLCLKTGLKIIGKFTDSRHYFADYILEKT